MFTHAITRKPGSDFAQGLTTANLGSPSYERLLQQHEAYVATLESLGVSVINLEPLPNYPDAYFVEDAAVITPEVAVITIPGAPARRGEVDSIAEVVQKYCKVVRMKPPGTLDGGDVLIIENQCFIGLSNRTNAEGAGQLSQTLEAYGYTCISVPVEDGLHLKSSVNYVGNNTLLTTSRFSELPAFKNYQSIILDEDEEYAGNTLLIGDCLLTPKGFPKTTAKLETLGLKIVELDMSEAQKMDGGLTCFSLRATF